MTTIIEGSPRLPALHFVENGLHRVEVLQSLPFVIGRAAGASLELSQPFVSRRHAEITWEEHAFVLRDTSSRHGTYVNGERVHRHRLRSGDTLQFGSPQAPEVRFVAEQAHTESSATTVRDLLGTLHAVRADGSELVSLRWFLEAARELSRAGGTEKLLASLLKATLSLARVERGFVFLAGEQGRLALALGLDANGHALDGSNTVSQTILRRAVEARQPFLVTDTMSAQGRIVPESLIAHNIRSVICIPLRRPSSVPEEEESAPATSDPNRQLLGVLYLDSRYEPARLSEVDHDLMCTIAREAAALVRNAQLASAEEQARQHEEELQIAAAIQRGLMAVQMPRLPFAEVQAESIACKAVGGDFFDVLSTEGSLSVALVDVSGKGISAAILASTLQGMLYVQLEAGRPLHSIAVTVNDYLCQKSVGKYATMLLARLHPDGQLEYMNCGHIRPRLCTNDHVESLPEASMPVGLLRDAVYGSGMAVMKPGSRLVLVSDGFTEAEDADGNFFGEERLELASTCGEVASMLGRMRDFCAHHPLSDDCTIVQITFKAEEPGSVAQSS